MIRLNVHDAKTHLSKYLDKLEKGETILLCRRNQPIAEIRPVSPARKKPRPIGLDEGKIKLGPEFFEPLSGELLAAFTGEKP
jgi:antitoxin (DNA-binding transcriptional repressor) of toxin-antitoxin stability system